MENKLVHIIELFSQAIDRFFKQEITAFELSELSAELYFYSGFSKELQKEVPEVAWLMDSVTALVQNNYSSELNSKDTLIKNLHLFSRSKSEYTNWWYKTFGDELRKENVFR
jgi:hypothetical protein